jgi:hypothetical protein
VPAGVQAIEIGNAVDAEQHRFAVDRERGGPVPQRGLDDQRIALSAIVAVAREQPHLRAVALDDQAIAVVLYFVQPIRPARNFGSRVGMQGTNAILRMPGR